MRPLLLGIAVLLSCMRAVAQGAPLTLEQILDEEAMSAAANEGVRAQLVAINRTVLAAGISSRVASVHYSVGDAVEQDAVLLEFDCASLEAQRKIYAAQERANSINLEVKQRLLELNNVGAQELELARAELAAAAAQLEVVNVQLRECRVHAPFSGIITQRGVEPFQYVGEGTPILELTSRDQLEALLVAPSSWLGWLQPGEPFTLRIEETGEVLRGMVARLGGKVDPISQTILIYGALVETSDWLLPGMSGEIRFNRLSHDG